MPPEVMYIDPPEPRNYGPQAREWLESQGVNAIIPSIRSRDESDAQVDPFLYYLKRRLGLTPILSSPSKALTRGTWVHKYLEHASMNPSARETAYKQSIDEREQELRERCKLIGWQAEKMLATCMEEVQHAACARGWLLALTEYRNNELPSGLFGYLAATNKQVLATELTVSVKDAQYPRTPLCATFDALNYYPLSKTIWVDDYKSHENSPLVRAEPIRHSFQTLHYRYLLRKLLDCGWLHSQFPQLPPDVKIGGMRHILIQKPSIELCGKDRPYLYTSIGGRKINGSEFGSARAVPGANGQWHVAFFTRTGKDDYPWNEERKVKTATLTEDAALEDMATWCGKKPEKEYSGEPSSDLYAKRCLDWYMCRGEYVGEDRSLDPPINISSIEGDLDDTETIWYHKRLARIYEYATCAANPILFPPTGRGMLSPGGKTNQYAIFFNRPVFEWPDLIRMYHFTQVHLDVEEAS